MLGKDKTKLKSFLGAESEVKGEFVFQGILRIDGKVTGKIKADQVILTETAVIKGDILAKSIILNGEIEGNLKATDLLEIRAKGKVNGEIFTQKLLIEDGAEFNGRIQMSATESTVLDFESKNQDVALQG